MHDHGLEVSSDTNQINTEFEVYVFALSCALNWTFTVTGRFISPTNAHLRIRLNQIQLTSDEINTEIIDDPPILKKLSSFEKKFQCYKLLMQLLLKADWEQDRGN